MTPQEKAKELVEIYYQFDFNTIINSNKISYAKQCALISVDEIIKELIYSKQFEYWYEVKQEIEKL